ncbi:hypothetical protein [Pannonibacter sp. SL95]|uniref:hypothetical protein n=1 Tax=Pannonibacter sp. SL95 TaxID=2995153 RepID=UPI002275BEB1|nr:hypothetical protein [Pannonibacter sp. SL95]MCY1708382.1 hypothetical protein [Pannonibacter sp. SL95]
MAKKDPLADLDVDLEAATETGAVTTPQAVEVGEIETGVMAELPPSARSGGGGGTSKYAFDKLAAPSDKGFSFIRVKAPEGASKEDTERLRRSVQSATTNRNRAAKERNEPNYYETRTEQKDGSVVAVLILRTDKRPK